MPTDFPGGVDDIQNDVSNSTVLTDLHPSLHNDLADAIMAIETQVLAGGGTVADGSITSAKIADGTIVAGDIADGAVTSAKILDGTIATTDLANSAVTNVKLASDTARANLLVNSGFEVWQRGNGPFAGDSIIAADRWKTTLIGSDTISISKDTTNKDTGSQACAVVTFTLGSGAGATAFFQDTNNSDGMQLRGVTLSVSVRVRTATANACRVGLGTNGTGSVSVFSSFHTGSGIYQTLTTPPTTIPADATIVRVNVFFAASCTAYIDNAMLVVGSVPADYAPLHPADDLARCQRYYETMGGYATDESIGLMWCYAASGGYVPLRWKVRKAVVPTVTSIGSWRVQYGAGVFVAGTLSGGGNTIDGCTAVVSGTTGLTVGQVASVTAQNATTSMLLIESNP